MRPITRALICSGALAVSTSHHHVLHDAGRADPSRLDRVQTHDRDHEQARAAVAAGTRLSLSTLLRQVEADHPGRVLEVELEFDEGRQREVYEIEILDSRGRVIEVFVDALDGAYVDEPED
jgi:uncharacterized membrane protein YkoI